ncbi:hypothetical protein DXG03_009507 [Asterophora parasitica]|uniref:Uncharacterized protein n=1 Tax=Asterophora parasitica TaxID=117018 RepID=A0A9P7G4D1_9AGAR|nr:hypothetical protein DXG03_009507 [Asterophora parasitica]
MSTRPEASVPVGPKFTITVPPNWYAITTAVSAETLKDSNTLLNTQRQISRKPYSQGVAVSYDFFVKNTRIFGSEATTPNDQMKITLDKATSLPLLAQEDEYDLEFEFYYSTQAVKNAEVLRQQKAYCSKIHVVKAAKLPGSYNGADNVTFFVFVEDTATQQANTGQYDDA